MYIYTYKYTHIHHWTKPYLHSTSAVPFLFASARHGKPLPTALQPLP